ncbi:MAG TPA: phosphoribosylformylglycinamidine synthase subunit PurS [Candidatus Dormibacteraeota bacterium]|jgi:phosphoribosylformylglycinamidine synthase|nr:phosphoribosylformylglycinamidine synthase subunit PurS [Candidatus Dormibacteraeota bacterium]
MIYAVEVAVTLKPVVNDPQGLVVRDGLRQLGFSQVRSARVGKVIALELEASSDGEARAAVVEMCEKLLRNPVIEDFHIESLVAGAEVG